MLLDLYLDYLHSVIQAEHVRKLAAVFKIENRPYLPCPDFNTVSGQDEKRLWRSI